MTCTTACGTKFAVGTTHGHLHRDRRQRQRLGDGHVHRDRHGRHHGDGDATGTVPATLVAHARRRGVVRRVHAGVTKDYTASTTANVISTAGDATLSVSDPGHLTNGAFSLPSPLQVASRRRPGPPRSPTTRSTIGFSQHIDATDALRTGTYSKTLTFTLSHHHAVAI